MRVEKITTNVDTSKNNIPQPLRGLLLTTRSFGLTIIWPCQRHLWLALSPSTPLSARYCLWSLLYTPSSASPNGTRKCKCKAVSDVASTLLTTRSFGLTIIWPNPARDISGWNCHRPLLYQLVSASSRFCTILRAQQGCQRPSSI